MGTIADGAASPIDPDQGVAHRVRHLGFNPLDEAETVGFRFQKCNRLTFPLANPQLPSNSVALPFCKRAERRAK